MIAALSRIRDISNQMMSVSQLLDPARFRSHFSVAVDGSADHAVPGSGSPHAVSSSRLASPSWLPAHRTFPRMDRPAFEAESGTGLVHPGVDLPERAAEWLGPIHDAADRHGVPAELLTALVWSESAFRPDAVSHAGAIGLAQLMPGTAAMMHVDPFDPLDNLDGGARYLAAQLERFGSVDLALAAYNAGPGRVQSAGGIPNIAETRSYVAIVTERYDQLRGATA